METAEEADDRRAVWLAQTSTPRFSRVSNLAVEKHIATITTLHSIYTLKPFFDDAQTLSIRQRANTMSRTYSYDRYDNRRRPAPSQRSTLGYWVPLAVTVTLAAGGLAAWVWSTRDDHESTDHDITSDDENLSYGEEARAARERYGRDPRPGNDSVVSEGVIRDEHMSGGRTGYDGEGGYVGMMQELRKRTPSPAQAYDYMKKTSAAGIAVAGAAVGSALGAIREESADSRDRRGDRRNEEGYSDHERWSEEAERRVGSHADQSRGAVAANAATFGQSLKSGPGQQHTGGRRKMVAIVISSEVLLDQMQEDDGKYHSEHVVSFCYFAPGSKDLY